MSSNYRKKGNGEDGGEEERDGEKGKDRESEGKRTDNFQLDVVGVIIGLGGI